MTKSENSHFSPLDFNCKYKNNENFSDMLTDYVFRCVKYVDLGQIRRYPKQWFRIHEVCFHTSLSHKRSKNLAKTLC